MKRSLAVLACALVATVVVTVMAAGCSGAGATNTSGGPAGGTSATVFATAGGAEVTPLPRPVSPQSVKTKYTSLPYVGLSPSCRLDIYLPNSGRRPFPVIVQIHGGAFAIGDKRDAQLNPVLSALSRG